LGVRADQNVPLVTTRTDLLEQADPAQLVQQTSGPRAVELVQNGTLKTYPGFPHGMPTTHADTIAADLLAFIQS